MFTSITTKIYADLDKSVSRGTLKIEDLVFPFLEVLKDTPEYKKLKEEFDNIVDTYRFTKCNVWESFEMYEFFNEDVFDALNKYAPEGYEFGAHPGDGSDFGYWKVEESGGYGDDDDEIIVSKF